MVEQDEVSGAGLRGSGKIPVGFSDTDAVVSASGTLPS
jgi:hypothetical protein